jgi:hypothetical protein
VCNGRTTTSAAIHTDQCKVGSNLEKLTVAPLATQPSPLVRYFEWPVSGSRQQEPRSMASGESRMINLQIVFK